MNSSAVTGKKHQSTSDACPQDQALHETQWQKVLLFKIKTQGKLQYSHQSSSYTFEMDALETNLCPVNV